VFAVTDSDNIVQLASWVESLFPEGVIAMHVYGTVSTRHLFPEEQRCVATAVKKRQSELAAGRVCARRALAMIGFVEAPLLSTRDRTPLWPAGAIGSISHTDGYRVAVAGLARDFSGIGIDAEILGCVELKFWQEVFRVEEINRLQLLNESRQTEISTVMFSAKEAFYKCQFTLTGAWLGFEDISVETAEDRFQVLVCNTKAATPLPRRSLYGRFAIDGTRVVCGIAIQT
jgi:4'-phosphopantetheinyl transferase EntD